MAPADPKSALPGRIGPNDFAVQQLQGLACRWDNGLPYDPSTGGNLSSLSVVILPEAEGEWANYTAMYGDLPGGCSGVGAPECTWDVLTSTGVWVHIQYRNMRSEDARSDPGSPFMLMVESILATVAAAPVGARWSPHSRLALPEPCDLLSAEVIGTALEIETSSVSMFDGYIGGTSLEYEASATSGSNGCLWTVPQFQQEYGNSVNALVGGEWAWNEAHASDPTAEPLTLTGLSTLDSAWVSSYSIYGYGYLAVDLIIGGNWISFSVPTDALAAIGKDAGALTIMAQGVVDRLH